MRNKDKINIPTSPCPLSRLKFTPSFPTPLPPLREHRGDSCGQAIIVPCSNVGLLPGSAPSGQNCFSEHPTQATDPARTACCGAGPPRTSVSSTKWRPAPPQPSPGSAAKHLLPHAPPPQAAGEFLLIFPLIIIFFPSYLSAMWHFKHFTLS